ncbi:MAG TPA: DMT family transporter [Steroidobacter sp.]|jgi:drug/metabolite transporter (DMT)-like permease|nr:DMT family transporter [Steroidobacteraceae bacterium]HLS82917.1 DMT family transporter [Steroidobacter sp.]
MRQQADVSTAARPARPLVLLLTVAAMLAFAGNSLLCRLAFQHTSIDAAAFTTLRLVSGAAVLWTLVRLRDKRSDVAGSWWSALALFVYAATFSFAYLSLTVATGALLLFGAVQVTMIGYGLYVGERFSRIQLVGLLLACTGLVYLLTPGLSAPPLVGAALMIAAGAAWGVYTLRGKAAGDPTQATAGNFVRSVPFALALSLLMLDRASLDAAGVAYAMISGALTSGLGYAVWYTAIRELKATSAATVQLSVPVITAFGGVALLGEAITLRLVLASGAILGGVALVIMSRSSAASTKKGN